MTVFRPLLFAFLFLATIVAGLIWQDRAGRHDLELKKIAPATALQTPAVAPPINGDVLAMARTSQKIAEEKGRSFSFKGGGAEFNLGAGCNTCTQAAQAPAPVVAQAPPKAKPIATYRERPVKRERSIRYYRRFAQAETMVTAPRRAEARWGRDPLVMYAAPHAARNVTYARPPRGCPAGSTYTPVKMEGLRMLPNPGCHFSSHSACTVYAGQIGGSCDHCNDRNWANKPWVVRVNF